MGAKQKLNAHYVMSSVGAAALIGGAFSSWPVFLTALIIFLGVSIVGGDIRR
ncbi:MAG: hypothetical protein U0744_13575 [Gemmataceae bacterium]